MSRCFPYPPPGYCRNGAEYEALIESIKLQKEADKSRAERKKEKKAKKEKKEKKEKKKTEKRRDEEKANLQKDPTEYQQDPLKLLPKDADDFEGAHDIEAALLTGEVLEKSDLTEEHGRPIGSTHKPSYSSDSTQNSNKRKRDDAVLPDVPTVHGKPIKIRLLKKHKVSDSSNEILCSNSGRTDPSSLSGADGRLNNVPLLPSSPYSDRKSGLPATLGRENNAAQGVTLSQTKSGPSSLRPGTRTNDKQSAPIARPIPDTDIPIPSSSKPRSSLGRPVLPRSRLEPEIPSSSKMPHPTPSSTKADRQGLPSGLLKHGPSDPVSAIGKRAMSEVPVPTAGLQKKTEEPQKKVKLTKTEKKMRKKHAKYEKVIGSWVPPVFQAMLPDDDDEDWLSRRTKTARLSFSKADVETCRDSAMLWQPCARFLADVDIHALPYTVPF